MTETTRLIAYRCRLYPNQAQQQLMERTFGCVRWVYNEALAHRIAWWGRNAPLAAEQREKSPTAIDLQKRLPVLKQEHPWLAEVDSQALKEACRDLDLAFSHFFRRVKQGGAPGFPRFKSRRSHASFTTTQVSTMAVAEDARSVKMPKLGWVRARGLRVFSGRIQRMTVSRSAAGKYWCSVLVKQPFVVPETVPATPENTVGIDMGVARLATLSNGQVLENPRCLQALERRLRRAQRKLARRTKGGANWHKQKQEVARLHEQVANARRDYLHKTTTVLLDHHQAVALEDLRVANLMAKPKPVETEPGKYSRNGRAAKRGLSRGFAEASLGEFTRQLEYKAAWRGATVIFCNPRNTSKTCSECGHVLDALPLSVRTWDCPNCGAEHDRDHNAARNIQRLATVNGGTVRPTGTHACGDHVRPAPAGGVVEAGNPDARVGDIGSHQTALEPAVNQ